MKLSDLIEFVSEDTRIVIKEDDHTIATTLKAPDIRRLLLENRFEAFVPTLVTKIECIVRNGFSVLCITIV